MTAKTVQRMTSFDGSVILVPPDGSGVVDVSANPNFGPAMVDLNARGLKASNTAAENDAVIAAALAEITGVPGVANSGGCSIQNGGILFVRLYGSYLWSGLQNLPSYVTLQGVGWGVRMVNTHATNDSLQWSTPGGTPTVDRMRGFGARDIWLDTDAPVGAPRVGQYGIEMDTCDRYSFNNVLITNHDAGLVHVGAFTGSYVGIQSQYNNTCLWLKGVSSTPVDFYGCGFNHGYVTNIVIEHGSVISFHGGNCENCQGPGPAVMVTGDNSTCVGFFGINFEHNNGTCDIQWGDGLGTTPDSLLLAACRLLSVDNTRTAIIQYGNRVVIEGGRMDTYSIGVANHAGTLFTNSVGTNLVTTFANIQATAIAASPGLLVALSASCVYSFRSSTGPVIVGAAANGMSSIQTDVANSLIVPMAQFPSANVAWSTLVAVSTAILGGYLATDSAAQNNEGTWRMSLAAGTYSFRFMYQTNTTFGIMHIFLDGVDIGSIDTYSAAGVSNVQAVLTTVVVANKGDGSVTHDLRILMDTKNGASAGYTARLGSINARRTA